MKYDLSKLVVACCFTAGILVVSHPSYGSETDDLKNQVKTLQQRIDQLEKQVANGQSNSTQGSVNLSPSQPHTMPRYQYWDPFVQMQMMERQMDAMMKDNMADFNPREDIKQTPDAYIISMDLPGMDKDNINVEIKNGMLVVSGERTSEVKEDQPNKLYRQERSFGHFYRTLALPDDAKADSIDAQYNNGVLTVKVARDKNVKAASNGQKIKVK